MRFNFSTKSAQSCYSFIRTVSMCEVSGELLKNIFCCEPSQADGNAQPNELTSCDNTWAELAPRTPCFFPATTLNP